ncbi:MAG TPA: hypothetical protein VLH13_02815, partial [Methanomassiliicoccales archaeon]|nr:hypothetical protein [Methanomassiliicoccales archaeon]
MTSRACPCCGSKDLCELKQVGTDSKFVCKRCSAILTKDRSNICPRCNSPYFDVQDNGTETFFVHSKEFTGLETFIAKGCNMQTDQLGGFRTADVYRRT